MESRIRQVNQKLNLICPRASLLQDLQLSIHNETPYFDKIKAIFERDMPQTNIENRLENCEELAESLIKMATDKSLLGRMWIGWAAFI